MATAIIPSGTGTQTQEITINNLVKKWNAMTPNQQAKNYVNFKNKLNNKLTQEQKNKVIKYINNKLTQEQKNKVNSKSFTGEGRRLTNVNRTILKEQLLNTYLTFTYEMGPGMEKKYSGVMFYFYCIHTIKYTEGC
jgi:predicted RND superfamily exporter protein